MPVNFRERKTITGKRFLLTWNSTIVSHPIFISLDFSFREKIVCPTKSIIKTSFPVLFHSYIYHPNKDELLAEKIRALITRKTGRDIYDIWFLLNQGAKIDQNLVLKKLKYYRIDQFDLSTLKKAASRITKNEFVKDLRPFVSPSQRKKLASFYNYLIDFLNQYSNPQTQ